MSSKLNACIVVGIGNPLLTDDRAGLEVVAALQADNVNVNTAVLHSNGLAVLDTILGYDKAVIVHACKIGLPPGTVLETTADLFSDIGNAPEPFDCVFKAGNVRFPELMPSQITIFQVEAEDLSNFSNHCTPIVSHAVSDVVNRIQMATG